MGSHLGTRPLQVFQDTTQRLSLLVPKARLLNLWASPGCLTHQSGTNIRGVTENKGTNYSRVMSPVILNAQDCLSWGVLCKVHGVLAMTRFFVEQAFAEGFSLYVFSVFRLFSIQFCLGPILKFKVICGFCGLLVVLLLGFFLSPGRKKMVSCVN